MSNSNVSVSTSTSAISLSKIAMDVAFNANPNNTVLKHTKQLTTKEEHDLFKTDLVIPSVVVGYNKLYGNSMAVAMGVGLTDTVGFSEIPKVNVARAIYISYLRLMYLQAPRGNKGETFKFPIAAGQQFVIMGGDLQDTPDIAGLDMIMQVGSDLTSQLLALTHYYAVESTVCQQFDTDSYGKICLKIAKARNYTMAAVKTAMTNYYTAPLYSTVSFLVDSHVYKLITDLFKDVPDNIIAVDSNWHNSLNFRITQRHVVGFFESFIPHMGVDKNGAPLLTGTKIDINGKEYTYRLSFENKFFLDIKKEGVYEVGRHRQLYNAVITNHQALTYTTGDISPEDIAYLNSFAVLIRYVAMNVKAFCLDVPYMAAFFRKRISVELPFVALSDLGVDDGDRNGLTKFTTQPDGTSLDYVSPSEISSSHPFTIRIDTESNRTLILSKGYYVFRKKRFQGHRIDAAVFTSFNLVRNKDKFVDGRRVALQLKHVPIESRVQVAQAICARAYGQTGVNLDAAVTADFGLQDAAYNHNDLWLRVSNELVVGLSSKLSKLVKRAVMYCAQIGHLEDGGDKGFMQFGQSLFSTNTQAVKSVISLHHNASPGMAESFVEDLFTLTVPHTIKRVINVQPIVHRMGGTAPKELLNKVRVDFDNCVAPTSITADFGNSVNYNWDAPINVEYGAAICHIPYVLDNKEFAVTVNNTIPEGKLSGMKVDYVRYGIGMQIEVELYVSHSETSIKARDIQKAVVSQADPSAIYNNLNNAATKSAADFVGDVLWYRDTNKWQDVVSGLLPVIYLTAKLNPSWVEANLIIDQINEVVGRSYEWSPVIDLMGGYDALRNAFDDKFKRTLWVEKVERNTDKDLSHIALQYSIYANADWFTYEPSSEVLSCIPSEFTEITAIADTELISDETNIQIFAFTADGRNMYHAQRSMVYVGTSECPVYLPVKAEVSSVRTAVGRTKMMAGMIRSIAKNDKDFANSCVQGNFAAYEKYAAFIAMVKNKTIVDRVTSQPLKEVYINFLSEETGLLVGNPEFVAMLQTEEIKALKLATSTTGTFMKELARKFNDVVFVCNVIHTLNSVDESGAPMEMHSKFSLYLPAIVAQSAAADFRSTDDMSSNVQDFFKLLSNGATFSYENVQGYLVANSYLSSLMQRIYGAMNSLINSKSLTKCAAFGIDGVSGKSAALTGIKMNEMYIRKSRRFNSIYATMQRTYDVRSLDGLPVLFGRSPMTTIGKVKIVVIDDNHWAADYISEDMFYLNPVACYLHRGDNDGDLISVYSGVIDNKECQVPYLTNTILINSIRASTGDDQLRPGASYYGDGFEVPSAASVAKKRKFSSANLTLSSISTDMLDGNSKVKANLGQLLSGSTKMLQAAVGEIHRVFLTTDIYVSAMHDLAALSKVVSIFESTNPLTVDLIQILAEIYEVPLAGFDKWAYIVFYKHLFAPKQFTPKSGKAFNVQGKSVDNFSTLSGALKAAGMNGDIAISPETGEEISNVPAALEVAVKLVRFNEILVSMFNKIELTAKWDRLIADHTEMGVLHYFFAAVSAISVDLSKGKFHPVKGADFVSSYDYEDPQDAYDNGYDDQEGSYAALPDNTARQLITFINNGLTHLQISDADIEASVVFSPIRQFSKTVDVAINGEVATIDVAKLSVRGKAIDVDSVEYVESTEFLPNAGAGYEKFFGLISEPNQEDTSKPEEVVELITAELSPVPLITVETSTVETSTVQAFTEDDFFIYPVI